MPIKKLHFVYNVDATPQALAKDFVHRLLSPATYPCKLCDLSYGRFVKNPGWQLFIWGLPVQAAFYTKDRFVKKYSQLRPATFPAVFAEDETGVFSVFIASEAFAAIASLAALKHTVEARLKASA